MSLTEKKSALFGKSSAKSTTNASTSTASSISNTSVTTSSSITQPQVKKPSIAYEPKSSTTSLSREAKLKKIEEAKQLSSKGMAYLQKTVFQWTPDYLAAAPCFEKASDLYKQVEEYRTACDLLVKAAESYESYGLISSAALIQCKIAQIASKNLNLFDVAAKRYDEAATLWATNGELDKSADCLIKASKELEDDNLIKATEFSSRACELLCPRDTPKSNISQCHPTVIETFRFHFKLLLKLYLDKNSPSSLEACLDFAYRLPDLYDAFQNESSLCKQFLSISILQLSLGDVVLADQTYLNNHLNNTVYLTSKESEVAELFIMGFKRQDLDKLDEGKRHVHLNYLEYEIQTIAKKLSLFKSKNVSSIDKFVDKPIEGKASLFSHAANTVKDKTDESASNLSNELDNIDINVDEEELDTAHVEDTETTYQQPQDINEFAVEQQDDEDEIDLS